MKKIKCELVRGDYIQVKPNNGDDVDIDIFNSDKYLSVTLSPDKIRKLRKQLKKALLKIEGVKEEVNENTSDVNNPDEWFYPGKKVVITGKSNGFPIGEIVVVCESWQNDDRSKKCEYLDGHDYWFVRPSDCKPYEEDEA